MLRNIASLLLLTFCLILSACTPTQTSEVSETLDVLTPTPLPTATLIPANTSIIPPAATDLATDTIATLTQALFGTATPTQKVDGLKIIYTSAGSGGIKCDLYPVLGYEDTLSTDPTTCAPKTAENNTLWGKGMDGNRLLELFKGQLNLEDFLKVDMTRSSANSVGFGMDPTDGKQGLQFMPVNFNYLGKTYTALLWLTADAPQATVAPATDENGNPVDEDGGSGGGGGGTCPDGSTPVGGSCPPVE